jgi:hypothetical protein
MTSGLSEPVEQRDGVAFEVTQRPDVVGEIEHGRLI